MQTQVCIELDREGDVDGAYGGHAPWCRAKLTGVWVRGGTAIKMLARARPRGRRMKHDEPLPLTEQVGEVKARAEDRLEQAVVPALDGVIDAVATTLAAVRERLGVSQPESATSRPAASGDAATP